MPCAMHSSSNSLFSYRRFRLEFHRFLIWLLVRFGRLLAILLQLVPCWKKCVMMTMSSSCEKASFDLGLSWKMYRLRHCLFERPGKCSAIQAHLLPPVCCAQSMRSWSSSLVQEILPSFSLSFLSVLCNDFFSLLVVILNGPTYSIMDCALPG